MSDATLREALCTLGRSLFERGLTHGSTGNLSVRTDEGYLLTPTGSSLGALDPARLSLLDAAGVHARGDPPTKEALLHLAMYRERPRDRAVVHLHSVHSVAVSVLADVDPENVLPPLTAYYAMRIGMLPLLPYFAPGDPALAEAVGRAAGAASRAAARQSRAGRERASLSAAADAIEELEATAKLWLLIRHERVRLLDAAQLDDLAARYPR